MLILFLMTKFTFYFITCVSHWPDFLLVYCVIQSSGFGYKWFSSQGRYQQSNENAKTIESKIILFLFKFDEAWDRFISDWN